MLDRATHKKKPKPRIAWSFSNGVNLYFLFPFFQHSLTVKHSEKVRLERVLRKEERELQKAEAELKLAQQAFDQFLQEKDRKAIEAQKRSVTHIPYRTDPFTIKSVD